MPLIETDLLKAYLDPGDDLHSKSIRAFELLSKGGSMLLSSVSLLELDLLLKSHDFSAEERESVFHTLGMRLLKARVATLTIKAMQNAVILQRKYNIPRFYFDSLHLGLAICHDGKIISSDEAFDSVKEISRINPAEL